jgi:hypothetical protein
MKILKALPRATFILSLIAIVVFAGLGSTKTISFASAWLMMSVFAMIGFIAFGAINEVVTLEKSLARQSKGSDVNTQYDYTPLSPDYASVFREGMPVVTTGDYYEGPGYHAFILKMDKHEKGMPLKIQLCGNKRTEWVSENEVIPEYEMEVVL